MKIMFLQWLGQMQQDMEDVLLRMRISYRVFFYPILETEVEDEYFQKHFERALRDDDYDAVFSFDFLPSASKCCYAVGIPYIAWVYDSGLGHKLSREVLTYPQNYIFLFDRYEYEKSRKEGLRNTYHMPLAVNVERLDQMVLSEDEWARYKSDLSFVGSLYTSGFPEIYRVLSGYERGLIDSLVETQLGAYGEYYLDQFIDGSVKAFICERFDERGESYGPKDDFYGNMQDLLSCEVTNRERKRILKALSEISDYHMAFYTSAREPEASLRKVDYRRPVECFQEIYRVYKSSKVNLNVTFRRIVTGIPLRALDIMGSGGFLLSNYQQELAEYFKPGIDCVLYDSIEDAVKKARYYLSHETERKEIAANGHEAVKQFSYENQLGKIFDIVFS